MGGNLEREQAQIVTLSARPTVHLPTDKGLVLKVIPKRTGCNANGDLLGGWVMAQVTMAGTVIPARYTIGRQATVPVYRFVFKQPVCMGHILSFFSSSTRIGRTAITVQVGMYAQRRLSQGESLKVTEASVTWVAIDDQGRPREIANLAQRGSPGSGDDVDARTGRQ